jgi:hypothetical protein
MLKIIFGHNEREVTGRVKLCIKMKFKYRILRAIASRNMRRVVNDACRAKTGMHTRFDSKVLREQTTWET